MEKPKPKVIRVLLEEGEHTANAVLYDWGSAITINAIDWGDGPPLRDDDNSFKTVEAAVQHAHKLWLKVLL